MKRMSKLWISVKVYKDKWTSTWVPVSIWDIETNEVCIDRYLRNGDTIKFQWKCFEWMQADAYIKVCVNDKQVREWYISKFSPLSEKLWEAVICWTDIRGWLNISEKKRFIRQPYWFEWAWWFYQDALQSIIEDLNSQQSKENWCLEIPESDWTRYIFSRDIWDSLHDVFNDTANALWLERTIVPWVDDNWEPCCNVRFSDCLWIDKSVDWINYEEVTFDWKRRGSNDVNEIKLVNKTQRKNEVMATWTIWESNATIFVDDWAWCIVWWAKCEFWMVWSLAELESLALEKLNEVNVEKKVFKVWIEKNAVNGDVWDKLRLLITNAWKLDFDDTVTVVRKTTKYKNQEREEVVYIWDPEIYLPTRSQILDSLWLVG